MRSVWWQTDLHRDMAYYGYTAQVILRGGLPFRDVDTDKPVLLYYWLAPFLQIFGIASPLGVHVAASLCVAATIIPLYFAGRQLGPSVGLTAVSLFVSYSLGTSMEATQPCIEQFMLPFMVATLATLLGRCPPSNRALRWAGLSLGMATLVKQSGIFFLLHHFCLSPSTMAGGDSPPKRRLSCTS